MERQHGNPRRPRGKTAGPGGPDDRRSVVIDATDAVLLDEVHVSLIEPQRGARPKAPGIALTLGGRINMKTERAQVMFLFEADGAAAIISELLGLAQRAEGMFPDLMPLLLERIRRLPQK